MHRAAQLRITHYALRIAHYASRITHYALCIILLASCIREEATFRDNSKQGNLDALWTIIDRNYCFLTYKQIDWDKVHADYSRRITNRMTTDQFFEVCCDMLAELRDGHVNLSRAADMGRYWAWYEDHPFNFDPRLQEHYLGHDYRIAAGIKYRILDDNTGYMAINSFSNGFGDGNLDEVMFYLRLCNGLIIDVRDNGGGNLNYAQRLAERFTTERRLVGYIMHKTGPGHDDFSTPEPEYIDPADGIIWTKPVVVLTNRHCYSATNTFVRDMKGLPLVTILGDQTGGGSGMPYSSELPNGWAVRFSAVPMLDAQKQHIEFGIQPDIECGLDPAAALQGRDSMIEAARDLLRK